MFSDDADDDGQTLSDRAFRQISDAIVRGEIEPGAKLSEPDLSRRLGVSRGPLREAIRRLEERRLVTRSPRLGARVVVITPEMISETFAIREVLEGLAAREAAARITDVQVDELYAMLQTHEVQLDLDSRAYVQNGADEDFHFAIVRYSGSASLFHLLCDEYYQLIRLYRYQHAIVSGRAQRAFIEHQRIAAAIADRDADLAEMLMRRHIQASRANMEKALAARAEHVGDKASTPRRRKS
ncbi:GntR family transcriptional regulator [Chelatococcus sp. YT9]|nr:GntR family transcriptional regulator [Chelatococcus sp. YT9]